MSIIPQKIEWSKRYSDDSGVEFAVRYDQTKLHHSGEPTIQLESISTVDFPLSQLDWLIYCLSSIRTTVEEK